VIGRLLVAFLVLMLSGSSLLAAASVPTFQFSARSVTVSGVTNGGSVAFFAVAKEPTLSVPPIPLKTTHTLILHDEDGDGDVVLERELVVPVIGIWIAVDMTTGQWIASGSPGFVAEVIPAGELAKKDNAGQLRKLDLESSEADVLLVRPGAGAWSLFAARTGRLDESAKGDRSLRVDIAGMRALGSSAAGPPAFRKGDIIAVIDARAMRYRVVEVGQ